MPDGKPPRSAPLDLDPSHTAVFDLPRAEDLKFLSADTQRMQVEVLGGPMDGRRRPIESPIFAIGRGETNDLALSLDLTISTDHARIIEENGRYWLEDLDSRNGTYIGDQRIHALMPLTPGTLFFVGRTCLEFMAV